MGMNVIDLTERLKRAVFAGGGNWVGLQSALTHDSPNLIMFTSPTTGSTLAVPISTIALESDEFSDTELSAAVHKRIEESDLIFANRSVSVKASRLKEISDNLLKLSHELDDLYFRREKCLTSKKS